MNDLLVEGGEFAFIEAGGGAAKMGKVETVDQRLHVRKRLDGLRTAQSRQQRGDGGRLQPDFAEMGDAERTQPLGQLALASRQQRFMGKGRERRAQGREHLDLGRGVGHMILPAQDVGDAHVNVVDH